MDDDKVDVVIGCCVWAAIIVFILNASVFEYGLAFRVFLAFICSSLIYK